MATMVPAGASISRLIDHSGSMRGGNMDIALLLAEALVDLADTSGCGMEILGLTTVDWQGKPLRRMWQQAVMPFARGWLCALRHIIYRGFDAAGGFGLMLDDSICKENVDGEALIWAVSLLRATTANRRILIGLSDGASVDDATLTHSDDPALLWRHYQQAVAETEAASDVTLAVVAIRYERRFVQRRTKLDTVDEVADLALPFVADLITHR